MRQSRDHLAARIQLRLLVRHRHLPIIVQNRNRRHLLTLIIVLSSNRVRNEQVVREFLLEVTLLATLLITDRHQVVILHTQKGLRLVVHELALLFLVLWKLRLLGLYLGLTKLAFVAGFLLLGSVVILIALISLIVLLFRVLVVVLVHSR